MTLEDRYDELLKIENSKIKEIIADAQNYQSLYQDYSISDEEYMEYLLDLYNLIDRGIGVNRELKIKLLEFIDELRFIDR
jgi:hypothetical protein